MKLLSDILRASAERLEKNGQDVEELMQAIKTSPIAVNKDVRARRVKSAEWSERQWAKDIVKNWFNGH